MSVPDSFRTKRGIARFDDGAVRFEESVRGYLRGLYRDYWRSDARWRKAVFAGYALAFPTGLGWLALAVYEGDVLPVVGVVAVIVVLRLAGYLRGFRSPDRIRLADVESVAAIRGAKGLTRPRLVVEYAVDGSVRKRRVNLPSLYTGMGEETFERAVDAFEQRGADVERRGTDG